MQAESEGALVHPDYLPLFQGLWRRQQAAVQRAEPSLLEAAAATQEEARGQATAQLSAGDVSAAAQLDEDTPTLHLHQLAAVNAMRSLWAGSTNALLAHAPGLGKTATVVVFAQCLRWACPLWKVFLYAVLPNNHVSTSNMNPAPPPAGGRKRHAMCVGWEQSSV